MIHLINFVVDIGKLKDKKRKRWQVHQIEGAESAAGHIFRMAILSWLLSRKQKLNMEKLIKTALIHDICEVLTENETLYDPLLPKQIDLPESQAKIEEVLEKWPTFSLKEKKAKAEQKFEREYKVLLELISGLPSKLGQEIEKLWLDFEKGQSREGRFVKLADKAENLLQGLEYWKEQGKIRKDLWIRWAKEIFDAPPFLEFVEAIERKFLKGGISEKIGRKREMDRILDFLIEIGKLKNMPRKGLVLIGARNPMTIGEHIFRVTIMGWVLAEKREANLNIEKIIKMALVHDLCEVYAGDATPYEKILPKDKEGWPELFDSWPRFSNSKKRKIYFQRYRKERASLMKLTSKLPKEIRSEILALWLDFGKGLTKEGRFFKQVDRLGTLLQALEFARETKKPPYRSWWIGSKEKIDDPLLISFMDGLAEEFVDVSIEKK